MSGKSTGLVWDMRLRRDLKYVLLAYADHADHEGKNMYPSIAMIVWKTGYSESEVHRTVRELIVLGLLIEDGKGPHGTIRYRLGEIGRGANLTPYQNGTGANPDDAGGVIPSDQRPDLREAVTPELNGRTEESHIEIKSDPIDRMIVERALAVAFDSPNQKQMYKQITADVARSNISKDGASIRIWGLGQKKADTWQDNAASQIERALVGITNENIAVRFEP